MPGHSGLKLTALTSQYLPNARYSLEIHPVLTAIRALILVGYDGKWI
jgi:hypothetical protein